MNEMSAASQVVRVAEYLFEKYKTAPLCSSLSRRHHDPSSEKAMRSTITQAEHDRILHIFETQSVTVTELARRFGRSVGAVSNIVNRKHRLHHDQKKLK